MASGHVFAVPRRVMEEIFADKLWCKRFSGLSIGVFGGFYMLLLGELVAGCLLLLSVPFSFTVFFHGKWRRVS